MPMRDNNIVPGSLLVAPPVSEDPNFRRSVVLVCEHTEDGSFGLVLNRPLELHLNDILEEEDLPPQPVALGGPVQQDTLHYLHRHGARLEDSVDVAGGVYWGGDFDVLKEMLRTGAASEGDVRLFLGYAGWTAGQLEDEVDLDGWIVTGASPTYVFSEPPDRLWRTVLRSMGGEYAVLANFPEDPRMN